VSRDSLTRRLRCPRPALPTTEIPTADPAYIAKVKTAAPEQIVNKASIVMMQRGKPRELQRVSNGFTCLIGPDGRPLGADAKGMEWIKSMGDRTPRRTRSGSPN
jgi:hypothetical protein